MFHCLGPQFYIDPSGGLVEACEPLRCYRDCRLGGRGGGHCSTPGPASCTTYYSDPCPAHCVCYPRDGRRRAADNTWWELSIRDRQLIGKML